MEKVKVISAAEAAALDLRAIVTAEAVTALPMKDF